MWLNRVYKSDYFKSYIPKLCFPFICAASSKMNYVLISFKLNILWHYAFPILLTEILLKSNEVLNSKSQIELGKLKKQSFIN